MVAVNEPGTGYRPCLVLAHADPSYATAASRSFRRLGWDVYQAGSGPEARRLARMLEAELVVLDVGLFDESGWLTCAKLRSECPGLKVVLVGHKDDPRHQEMADFVGASALVNPGDDLTTLLLQLKAA